MLLTDVNVLVSAYRTDAPSHEVCRSLVERMADGDLPYGVSDLVLSGFLRVVTHPRVFDPPAPLPAAMEFAQAVRDRPTAVPVAPGRRHWDVFRHLCQSAGAKGNLVPDAYLAALAIESGCEWVTCDRGYARFEGLRWRHVRPV